MTDLVTVIIVSWNGKHWLKESLSSLFSQTHRNIEIVVVDNNSKDGTISWIKKNYPKVRTITMQDNMGFAQANNEAFFATKSEYVFFLNNDVKLDKNAIKELLRVVKSDSSIAGAQSKLLLMDQSNIIDTIGAFLTPTGFLYHYGFMNKDKKKFDCLINLYTPKGAAMLFRRADLMKVVVNGELFDKRAFAYFEETDLAHRVWLSGKRIVYAYKSIVYHKMGGTSTTMDNAFIQYHSFKNRIASYIKNISWSKLLPILCLHGIFIQIYALKAILGRKFSLLLAIEKAVLWNILFLPETLTKRKYIQHNIRRKSDDQLWKVIMKNPPLAYYRHQMQGKVYEEPVA